MNGQQPLPISLTPLSDLLDQAARARRWAAYIPHDPAAPLLEEYAAELEAEGDRLFWLVQAPCA